jgi:hypothetical protein
MDNIIEPTMNYDFSKLQLGIPVSHPNSTYITRLFMNNKPIYIQTPKCATKSGFITSGKKIYCDLMFSSDDSIFIDWVTTLEKKCHDLICKKSDAWFQTSYTNDDIESAFVSPLKIYRSGKYYLLRVNIKPNMKIYNDLNSEFSHAEINENTNMITIVEFYGIKFTSRNFQLEMELKQCMVVSPDEFLGNCFIKKTKVEEPSSTSSSDYQIPSINGEHGIIMENQVSLKENKVKEESKNTRKEEYVVPLENNHVTKEESNNNTIEEEHVAHQIPPLNVEYGITSEQQVPLEDLTNKNEGSKGNVVPLELTEFDFDINERLEESEPLQLKRPNDQYYNEYNILISKANKLKNELRRIYLEANQLKEKHSLVVGDIDKNIGSDIDISDNEDDDV